MAGRSTAADPRLGLGAVSPRTALRFKPRPYKKGTRNQRDARPHTDRNEKSASVRRQLCTNGDLVCPRPPSGSPGAAANTGLVVSRNFAAPLWWSVGACKSMKTW